MAGIWTIAMEIQNTVFGVSRMQTKGYKFQNAMVDGKVQRRVNDRSSTREWYCRDEESDITDYWQFLSTNVNDSTEIAGSITSGFFVDEEKLMKEFATNPITLMGNFDWDTNLADNLKIRGRFQKVATRINPDVRKILIKYYHRDSSGNETYLGQDLTANMDSGGAQTIYEETFFPAAGQVFAVSDRLVLKFYAKFEHGLG